MTAIEARVNEHFGELTPATRAPLSGAVARRVRGARQRLAASVRLVRALQRRDLARVMISVGDLRRAATR